MDIRTFLEFPGLLITIGVVLLIISIIIIVFAYKGEEPIDADELSEETKNNYLNTVMKEETKKETENIDNEIQTPKVDIKETNEIKKVDEIENNKTIEIINKEFEIEKQNQEKQVIKSEPEEEIELL